MCGLTENDVILANLALVRQACGLFGRTLDPQDRYQVALIGLLYAIRTYDGLYPFKPYATNCMEHFIREAEREQRRIRRAESMVSLDAPISHEGACTLLDLIGVECDFLIDRK